MSEIDMKILTDIVKDIKREFTNYYDYECDYGKGYLDCLWEVCKKVSIPAERTEMSLHILNEENSNPWNWKQNKSEEN